MCGVELRDLTAAQFRAQAGPLARIYAAAMGPPPEQLAGRRDIMERHAHYGGFRGVAAVIPAAPAGQRAPRGRPGETPAQPRLVGFAYGFHGSPGQWWHDVVLSALTRHRGAQAAADWLADSFEIAEVHVHPGYQGRGTGLAMMLRLTKGRPERTAVLSTMDALTRARRLYRGLGFTELLTAFAFPGADTRYVIMAARLPLRH